jgi:hypothetical protein
MIRKVKPVPLAAGTRVTLTVEVELAEDYTPGDDGAYYWTPTRDVQGKRFIYFGKHGSIKAVTRSARRRNPPVA